MQSIIAGVILSLSLLAPLHLNDLATAKTGADKEISKSRLCSLLAGSLLTGVLSILFYMGWHT